MLADVGPERYWKGKVWFSYDQFHGFDLVTTHHTLGMEVVEESIKCLFEASGLIG
jgi:hypothetical protein